MSDARLSQWLELSRAALAAPGLDSLESCEQLAQRRAALVESLAAQPLSAPLAAALAEDLQRCEVLLGERVNALLAELGARLAAVRQARAAVRSYGGERPSAPALVSRQV